MINGFHTLIYSDDPEATRAFLRDVLGWPWVDAGGGWMIFKTPPSELGVHPTTGDEGEVWGQAPLHRASVMCDDIHATVAELVEKGVAVSGKVEDQGYGLVTAIQVPGAGWMQLYEPRHPLAYAIDG